MSFVIANVPGHVFLLARVAFPLAAEVQQAADYPCSRMLRNRGRSAEKASNMAQKITVGYKRLVDEALTEIEEVSAEQAIEMAGRDEVVIVDIRDIRELWREGKIPGAYHAPRGMLEFWIDPESPYHKEIFAEDKTFVFHCAGGLRSALATQLAKRMGMNPVFNLKGGFSAWRDAGGPIETAEKAPGER